MKHTKVLGLDLETQGLEDNTKITEVGARLGDWIVREDGKRFLNFSDKVEEYCYEDDYPQQPEHIVKLTGITDEKLRHGGQARRFVLKEKLFPLIDRADVVFIHNKSFDWRILEYTCKEIGLLLPKKEVICTRSDIDWGPEFSCRKLQHLCIDHKMHFNPALAHRAIFDVDLMLELMLHYDLDNILKFAREPWVIYQAEIKPPWSPLKGGDSGVQRDIATKLGFRFEKIYVNYVEYKYDKSWVLRSKASKLDGILKAVEESKSPFEIREIK